MSALFSGLFGGGGSKMTPEEAKAIMDSGEDYTLVDVRSQAEFSGGHIKGAICLPVDTIQVTAPKTLKDKDAKILIYCQSGGRASQATSVLTGLGYTDVHNFGGLMQWKYGTVA